MLRRLLPLATLCLLVPATALAQGQPGAQQPARSCDWPTFGHDLSRDFTTACPSVPTTATVAQLAPRWVVHASDVVTAQPAVSDGTVYVGAWDGSFYAIDLASGAIRWQQLLGNAAAAPWTDAHHDAYGQITSSAAVASVGGRRTVLVGAADSLYALDAASGAILWRFDADPQQPTGAGEIESSPALWTATPNGHPWLIVGSDSNQSSDYPGEGVWAVDAVTGTAVWHFNPETLTGHPLYGCGNVWTSPAIDLDPRNPVPARRAMGFVGMADCPDNSPSGSLASVGPVSLPAPPGQGSPPPRPCPTDGTDPNCPAGGVYDYSQRWQRYAEAIVGLDLRTGAPVWSYQPHAADNTNDDDFGSSPQVFTLGGRRVVGEGNKDGSYSVVDRDSGTPVWRAVEQGNGNIQDSQAVGGFIGNTAVGRAAPGAPLQVFGSSAVDTPVRNDPATGQPVPQDDPTAFLTPMRSFDAASGAPDWQAPQGPSYGASTLAGGVVYNGALDGVLRAYDARSGALLWAFPLGAPISSGAAVAGDSLVIGAGTSDTDAEFKACDPLAGPLSDVCRSAPLDAQLNPLSRTGEIWAFSTAGGLPSAPATLAATPRALRAGPIRSV